MPEFRVRTQQRRLYDVCYVVTARDENHAIEIVEKSEGLEEVRNELNEVLGEDVLWVVRNDDGHHTERGGE